MTKNLASFLLACGTALALAACSSSNPALDRAEEAAAGIVSSDYSAIECADSTVFGPQWDPQEDQVFGAECWFGTPGEPFYEVADGLSVSILEGYEATDVSMQTCPQDSFNETGGIACRAFAFEEDDDRVLLRVIVVIRDIEAVLAPIGEGSSEEDVYDAIEAAEIEILVGTEPLA